MKDHNPHEESSRNEVASLRLPSYLIMNLSHLPQPYSPQNLVQLLLRLRRKIKRSDQVCWIVLRRNSACCVSRLASLAIVGTGAVLTKTTGHIYNKVALVDHRNPRRMLMTNETVDISLLWHHCRHQDCDLSHLNDPSTGVGRRRHYL